MLLKNLPRVKNNSLHFDCNVSFVRIMNSVSISLFLFVADRSLSLCCDNKALLHTACLPCTGYSMVGLGPGSQELGVPAVSSSRPRIAGEQRAFQTTDNKFPGVRMKCVLWAVCEVR